MHPIPNTSAPFSPSKDGNPKTLSKVRLKHVPTSGEGCHDKRSQSKVSHKMLQWVVFAIQTTKIKPAGKVQYQSFLQKMTGQCFCPWLPFTGQQVFNMQAVHEHDTH